MQLPKQLEVRPDDSEETANRKKRKLNMFKRQEKKQREEQAGDDRRSSWQRFASKNGTTKTTKNHHDPRWDPTRDHGELAARMAMVSPSSSQPTHPPTRTPIPFSPAPPPLHP